MQWTIQPPSGRCNHDLSPQVFPLSGLTRTVLQLKHEEHTTSFSETSLCLPDISHVDMSWCCMCHSPYCSGIASQRMWKITCLSVPCCFYLWVSSFGHRPETTYEILSCASIIVWSNSCRLDRVGLYLCFLLLWIFQPSCTPGALTKKNTIFNHPLAWPYNTILCLQSKNIYFCATHSMAKNHLCKNLDLPPFLQISPNSGLKSLRFWWIYF